MKRSGFGYKRGMRGLAGALLAGLLSTGCGAAIAESAFEADFACRSGVSAEGTDAPGRYVVEGCGRRVTYQCVGNYESTCVLQAGAEQTREDTYEERARPAPRPQPVRSEVEVRNKGDEAVMVLELVLQRRALLRLTATPDKRADLVQLKLVRSTDAEDADECNLDWMLNGQVIQMPKSVATRKGDVLSHRVQIGRALIGEFASVGKIALRVCQERFSLNPEQVEKVRDFMDRYQEEMAWKAPPREGLTAGMAAPTGGWPEWKPASSAPTAIEGASLDGRALFKKLSASVFKLEATLATGTSQGSAVAVSPSRRRSSSPTATS
jgi:hypothetical protein